MICPQPAFTCSKPTIETLEQGVKYVQFVLAVFFCHSGSVLSFLNFRECFLKISVYFSSYKRLTSNVYMRFLYRVFVTAFANLFVEESFFLVNLFQFSILPKFRTHFLGDSCQMLLVILTQFSPIFHFTTPLKCQKTFGFLEYRNGTFS